MTELTENAIPENWLYNQYGSKTGLVRYCKHEALRMLGVYNRFMPSASNPPLRLVFVCMGNICRSPLGEATARQMGMKAISFGLSTRGGDKADPRAIDYAARQKLDLSEHRTQKIETYKPRTGDWLVCMEPVHAERLSRQFDHTPVVLLGLHAQRARAYLHDPYNTNMAYFDHCEHLVMAATIALVHHVT